MSTATCLRVLWQRRLTYLVEEPKPCGVCKVCLVTPPAPEPTPSSEPEDTDPPAGDPPAEDPEPEATAAAPRRGRKPSTRSSAK